MVALVRIGDRIEVGDADAAGVRQIVHGFAEARVFLAILFALGCDAGRLVFGASLHSFARQMLLG